MAGFKQGQYRVLVATDVAARGIDIEALSHVVNFDVPKIPDDYIHRVGRTARAGATGEAFTFVAPEEQAELRAIERSVGKSLPRHTLAGFDYKSRPAERLEIPLAERIAEIRARKAGDRARARAKLARKAGSVPLRSAGSPQGRPYSVPSGGTTRAPQSPQRPEPPRWRSRQRPAPAAAHTFYPRRRRSA
jgi:ATP-dependent RNA helicase RhlE